MRAFTCIDDFAKKFDFSNIRRKLDGKNTAQVKFNEPFDKNEYEKSIIKEV